MNQFTVKVPPEIARAATEVAKERFLKPSEVVRAWMRKGQFAEQMEGSAVTRNDK